ncbi:MAG: hypothetical protein ACKOW9_04840 [Candidatus Paceibacterota bacterium]
MSEKLKAGVRKGSNGQWFGVLENISGEAVYFSEAYNREEEALEDALRAQSK